MTKCDLCGTQQSHSYGSVYGIGIVCHRCSLLNVAGPEMAQMPHCPPSPPDADPEVLAAYEKGTEAITPLEFDKWVENSRHDSDQTKGKERVQHEMTSQKIERWFSRQDNQCVEWESPLGHVTKMTFDQFQSKANSLPEFIQFASTTKEDINTVKKIMFELTEEKSTECGDCGCWASSMGCSRCHRQKYCSRVCQKRHWKEHKRTCCKTDD